MIKGNIPTIAANLWKVLYVNTILSYDNRYNDVNYKASNQKKVNQVYMIMQMMASLLTYNYSDGLHFIWMYKRY